MNIDNILNIDNIRLDHIAIAINSEEDIAIYDTLGLSVEHSEIVEEQGVKVFIIPVGDTRIELLLPICDDSPISNFLKRRGGGIHHLAFEVDDIMTAIEICKKRGLRPLSESPSVGAEGSRIIFLNPKTTNGVLIELRQSRSGFPLSRE